jgi:hypothetical protein
VKSIADRLPPEIARQIHPDRPTGLHVTDSLTSIRDSGSALPTEE